MSKRSTGVCLFVLVCCTGPSLSLHAQDPSALYVVSYIEAAAASQRQVATLLKEFADASRKEGAVRFEVLQRMTQPNHFLVLEVWRDQHALDAHGSAAHTATFRQQVEPLLLTSIDERVCVPTIVAPLPESTGAVYVVTHIDVPGTSRDAAIRLMEPLIDQSKREAGSVRFDLVHQKDRTNHFTAIEVWADQKRAEEHQLAPSTRNFRRAITPLLGALYDQRSYKPL